MEVIEACVDVLGSVGRCLLRNDAGRSFQHETASMAAAEEQCGRAGTPRQVFRAVQDAGREQTMELSQVTLIVAALQLLLPSPLLECCLPQAVAIGTKLVFLC